ncbi:MAG: helix-turn-helix domain-containing protein [Dyadobacter sp.]|uniref:helix-turn-helix domain-containing protein n=1 Tax=Dyadobacter sp. TaxID=1914288 RepID=UPI00326354C4
MFYVVGISIALFLSVIALTKSHRTTADTVLGIWLLLIGVHISLYYVNWITKPVWHTHLLGLDMPIPSLQNVSLYLYVGALTGQIDFRKRAWLLHLLPTATTYAYMIPFFLRSGLEKTYVYAHNGIGYETFAAVSNGWYLCSGVLYLIASGWFLRKYRSRVVVPSFGQPPIHPNWIQGLLIGMGFIWMVVQVLTDDQFVFGAVVAFVLWLGYFGIRQGNIFTEWPRVELVLQPLSVAPPTLVLLPTMPADEPDTHDRQKYARSGLTDEAATSLLNQLTDLMALEGAYRDPDLTLANLAYRLDVHPNYLSQVINERLGMTFADYVALLRIEAFKQLAAEPKNSHLTLLALAYECGFNSKSTFNRQFKKLTGQLPSAYWHQAKAVE